MTRAFVRRRFQHSPLRLFFASMMAIAVAAEAPSLDLGGLASAEDFGPAVRRLTIKQCGQGWIATIDGGAESAS